MEVVAPDLMVVNITYSCLKNLIELHRWLQLREDRNDLNYRVRKRVATVRNSPYYIKNDTGVDIDFAIVKGERNDVTVRQMLPRLRAL